MQIPATNASEGQKLQIYPAVTLARYSSDLVPEALVRVAGQVSGSPSVWPERPGEAPPKIVGSYYQQYTDEYSSSSNIDRHHG